MRYKLLEMVLDEQVDVLTSLPFFLMEVDMNHQKDTTYGINRRTRIQEGKGLGDYSVKVSCKCRPYGA